MLPIEININFESDSFKLIKKQTNYMIKLLFEYL
jgi:hypothetical protein